MKVSSSAGQGAYPSGPAGFCPLSKNSIRGRRGPDCRLNRTTFSPIVLDMSLTSALNAHAMIVSGSCGVVAPRHNAITAELVELLGRALMAIRRLMKLYSNRRWWEAGGWRPSDVRMASRNRCKRRI